MVPAASEDFLDQELARWFARHGGPWSGTASELLAAINASGVGKDSSSGHWPQSFRALYSHIDSHRQRLRCLGVDALLHDGPPRMITFRSCPEEEREAESSPGVPAVSPARYEADIQDEAPARSSTTTEHPGDGICATGHNLEGSIFKSTSEARFALVEMRVQIKEQGLKLQPAIDLVVRRTREITRSCGVAIGLLQKDTVVYPARAGAATISGTLDFQGNLFQSCLRTGRALQLRDAQNHPPVGAICRQEGIGSLIIMPLFHKREVAGAIEFLFAERRSFSIGDVMDLELIAGIISESLGGRDQMESKAAEEGEPLLRTQPVENIESRAAVSLAGDPLPGNLPTRKDSPVRERPASLFSDNADAQASLMTSI
jgi:GAF domain